MNDALRQCNEFNRVGNSGSGWCKHSNPLGELFYQSARLKIDETTVYQDNISWSYLLVNGQASSSKRTKHMNMNVCYFFAKDRIKNGKVVTIKHCPTKQMLADQFTKPLQGGVFREFRAHIHHEPRSCNSWLWHVLWSRRDLHEVCWSQTTGVCWNRWNFEGSM